jgi:hypothetical protein
VSWVFDSISGGILPGKIFPHYSCSCAKAGSAYKLEIELHVKTTVHLPSDQSGWHSGCVNQAEINHVDIYDGVIRRWLDTVLPYEHQSYGSQKECETAGERALRALGEAADKYKWLMLAAQSWEEVRHNFYNPCPFPGTL